MTAPALVRIPVTLEEAGGGGAYPASLRWTPLDPWAVQLVFYGPPENPWLFGWDLLRTGLHEETGIGDVRIRPMRDTVSGEYLHEITLRSPQGGAVLLASTCRLRAFAGLVAERYQTAVDAARLRMDAEIPRPREAGEAQR